MKRWHRFWRIAPAYLHSTARREWQLALLGFVALAPGVAAVTAWSTLAWQIGAQPPVDALRTWLLPAMLLEVLGSQGVLLGAGVVTLLVGCLGLANDYLASVERRRGELAFWLALGLSRREVAALLLIEVFSIGLLGSTMGLLLGLVLAGLSGPSAWAYFVLPATYHMPPVILLSSLFEGLLAALLFMGLSALVVVFALPGLTLRGAKPAELLTGWQAWHTTVTGALFAALLALTAGSAILTLAATLALTGLTIALSTMLSLGSWLFTQLYWRLPKPARSPLWALAVQGLTRHPRHTAGITLALTAGSYSVGLAALSWLDGLALSAFPFWVAAMVLVAGASLVLSAASLAALERRREYGLLLALGARRHRLWQLILLEYGIVAAGAGTLGALLAVSNWAFSNGRGGWGLALAIALAVLVGALVSAWAGAAPVLWLVTRRSPAVSLREP
ncbi:MAG TPA: ABC transporter permease [Caldilineaceae bacterium]|nr:ABC transporter permease [Caldilineaceae bacterium]